jgi:hypothetical protein
LVKEKDYRVGSESKDFKSFINWDNFEKYFTIQRLATDFPSSELENFRLSDYELYKEKIDEWITEGKISDIQDRLSKIVDFETFEEWENQLKILFHIGRFQSLTNGPYGLNYKQLINIISYPNLKNGGLLSFEDQRSYENYITKIFTMANEPFVFEANVLNAALTNVLEFPLDNNWIQNQLFAYLSIYCNNHSDITSDFRKLHLLTVERIDNYKTQIQPRAQQLFLSFFKTHLKACELGSFIRQLNPREEFYILDNEWINTIFENDVEFESYLLDSIDNDLDRESDCYIEFMENYENQKVSQYKAIPFDFKFITPTRWQ